MLLILSIVAAIAVQSLAPVVEQARFESTQRTLEQVRLAVVQVDNASVTTASVSGFVADNGRLPIQITLPSGLASDPLAELYAPSLGLLHANGQSNDLSPFQVYSYLYSTSGTPNVIQFEITGTSTISNVTFPTYTGAAVTPLPYMTIGAGWRGPYLRLPVGGSSVQDGWGNTLALTTNSDVLDVATSSNSSVMGVGTVDPISGAVLTSTWQNDYYGGLTGGVNVSVTSASTLTTGYLGVLLFSPYPQSAHPVSVTPNFVGTAVPAVGSSITLPYSFPSTYVGPRVLCAAYAATSIATDYKIIGPPLYVTVKPRSSTGPTWNVTMP